METDTMETIAPYLTWIVLAVVALPPMMGMLRTHPFIGFRFASTKDDPLVWERSNRFFGRSLFIGSLIGALITYFLPTFSTRWGGLTLVAILLTVIVVTFVYMRTISRPA